MNSTLSNVFIYGMHWQGEVLLQGRMTHRTLDMMKSLEKEYRPRREKALAAHHPRATGGFELAMQIAGNQDALNQSASIILEAWARYAALTRKFNLMKNNLFTKGLHIILTSWYLSDGTMRIRTNIILNDNMLPAQQLKDATRAFMASEILMHPDKMPKNYKRYSEQEIALAG